MATISIFVENKTAAEHVAAMSNENDAFMNLLDKLDKGIISRVELN
jgi:hypothetical protein